MIFCDVYDSVNLLLIYHAWNIDIGEFLMNTAKY